MNTKSFGPFDVGHGLTVEHVLVTPSLASVWLAEVPHSRRKDHHRIARYTGEIVRDAWRMTGETLRFDWDGFLLNGHHRLYAVAKAGVPVWMLIVRGVDPSTKETQDTGMPKRLADWSERSNANAGYAMVVSLLRVLSRSPHINNPRIKNQAWDLIGDEHIQFSASVKGSRVAQTAPCRMACAMIHRLDKPRAELFRDRLSKFDLPIGSVEQVYARQFDNANAISVCDHSALAVRAAMAAIREEAPKVLRTASVAEVIRVLKIEKIAFMLEEERAASLAEPLA
jgi:hypothetical protein